MHPARFWRAQRPALCIPKFAIALCLMAFSRRVPVSLHIRVILLPTACCLLPAVFPYAPCPMTAQLNDLMTRRQMTYIALCLVPCTLRLSSIRNPKFEIRNCLPMPHALPNSQFDFCHLSSVVRRLSFASLGLRIAVDWT